MRKRPLFIAALFVFSLLPRLSAIDHYVTPDEPFWVYSSVQFREALLDGRWADTLVTGHPGVTTTWLGALGISVQLAVRPADRAAYEWITQLAWLAPENTQAFVQLGTFLTSGRLAVALVNSLGVVGIYALACTLFGPQAASLGAFLLALDPYLSGLSGLLQPDGLTSTFATLSLLALGAADDDRTASSRVRRWYTVGAGALAALAVLSKSSALLLVPLSILGLLYQAIRRARSGRRTGRVLMQGFIWAAALVLSAALVLPALWAAPLQAAGTITGSARLYAGEALHPVFFLGQYTYTPGPLFYPIALGFRLSPIVLIGAVSALPLALSRSVPNRLRSRLALAILLWVLLFTVAVTLVAQKFSRYVAPVIPPLILISGVAWTRIGTRISQTRRFLSAQSQTWVLIGLQATLLLRVLPYPMAFFNPLLGGQRAAEKALTVGWGEPVSAASRWLAAQPGASHRTAVTGKAPSFAPFFPGRTLLLARDNLPHADYLVFSVNDRQIDPAGVERLTASTAPLHTVRFAGREQAWVYSQPTPISPSPPVPGFPAPLSFDRRVQLLGAGAQATDEEVQLTVRWGLLQGGGRYSVKLTLRDEWGHTWGQLETPLLNTVYFYPEHWLPGETPERQYVIGLPTGVPPAVYSLELCLFDTLSGARLPLLAEDGAFLGVEFTHDGISIPPSTLPSSPSILDIANPLDSSWSDGSLALLGHASLPDTLRAGDGVPLDLYWQTRIGLPDGLLLRLTLGDGVQAFSPLSRYPSGHWRPGELVREKYTLPIPPELGAGRYTVRVFPSTADGAPLEGTAVILGHVEITSPDRLLDLPSGIPTPLDYLVGPDIRLRGLALESPAASPGGEVRLILYWQAEAQPAENYTAFVHLIGPDGAIVSQADRWPGGSPTTTWAAGQVVVDEYAILLPGDAPPGQYQIATGLYRAASGDRILLTDRTGTPVPDNRLVLPATISVASADD